MGSGRSMCRNLDPTGHIKQLHITICNDTQMCACVAIQYCRASCAHKRQCFCAWLIQYTDDGRRPKDKAPDSGLIGPNTACALSVHRIHCGRLCERVCAGTPDECQSRISTRSIYYGPHIGREKHAHKALLALCCRCVWNICAGLCDTSAQ